MFPNILLHDKSEQMFCNYQKGDNMKLEYKHLKEMTFIGYYTEIKMNEGYEKCPRSGIMSMERSTISSLPL